MAPFAVALPWFAMGVAWLTATADYRLQRPAPPPAIDDRHVPASSSRAAPGKLPDQAARWLQRISAEEAAGHERRAADLALDFVAQHPGAFEGETGRQMVSLFVRAGVTLAGAPHVLRHHLATPDFWRQVFVDAMTDIDLPGTKRLLGRGLIELSRSPDSAAALRDVLATLIDYPPSAPVDELLAAFCEKATTEAARMAAWQARARRAALDGRQESFEEDVMHSGASEAWLSLAKLLDEGRRDRGVVRRAWSHARPSPARLALLDALHEERAAAEDSEHLARLPHASATQRNEALRRWIALRAQARAQELWDLSFARAPRDRDVLMSLIQAAVRLRDENRLARVAAQLARLDPHDDVAQESVGEAWDLLGQRQRALAVWMSLAGRSPGDGAGDPAARATRTAEILLLHDRPGAALDSLSSQRRRRPENVALLRNEALALEALRRRDEAFSDWWKIHESPNLGEEEKEEARRHLSTLVIAVRPSDLEKMTSLLRAKVETTGEPAEASLLSRLLRQLGRWDEARDVLQRTTRRWLVEHGNDDGFTHARDALTTLASGLRELHAPAEERELWRLAVAHERPPCAFCLWQQVLTSFQQGRTLEAEHLLDKARDHLEADRTASPRLAELSEKLARPDLAQHFLEQTLSLEPSNLGARLAAARWRLRAADPVGASALETTGRTRNRENATEDAERDLATQELVDAQNDLSLWSGGVAVAPLEQGASSADWLASLRPLEEPSASTNDPLETRRRVAALRALSSVAATRALPFRLSRALRNAQGDERKALLWYAGIAKDPDASSALLELVNDRDRSTAALAVLAWRRTTGPRADQGLQRLLSDPERPDEVRAAAALGLGWTVGAAPSDRIRALLSAVESAPGLVGVASARALGALAPPSLRSEVEGRGRQDPGSSFALALARWGEPLPQYLSWPCGTRLEGLTALEGLLADSPVAAAHEACARGTSREPRDDDSAPLKGTETNQRKGDGLPGMGSSSR